MIGAKEAAEALGVSYPTFRKFLKMGMPHIRIGNRLYRFEIEKIKEWLVASHGVNQETPRRRKSK